MSRPTLRTGFVWRKALCEATELSGLAKSVGHVLERHMDAQGFARPGIELLSAEASWSIRSVQKAIAELENASYITVQRSHGRIANRYYAAVPDTANEAIIAEFNTIRTPQQTQGPTPTTLHLMRGKARSTPHHMQGGNGSNPAAHPPNPAAPASNPAGAAPEASRSFEAQTAARDARAPATVCTECETGSGHHTIDCPTLKPHSTEPDTHHVGAEL